MYNYNYNFKNQKIAKINNIIRSHEYVLVCNRKNLQSLEIINLKNFLKINNINMISIKQNLLKNNSIKLYQGSIFFLYSNNFNDMKQIFKIENNIQILYLINKNLNLSVLKLKKILKSDLHVFYYLKKYIYFFFFLTKSILK